MICIPIIDTIKHNANIDERIVKCKLKKDLSKELYSYKTQTHEKLSEEEILNLYDELINKLSIINTF